MLIGVPRETFEGEKRVALIPSVVDRLVKQGFEVAVEKGAGERAFFSDDDYTAVGAKTVNTSDVFKADLVVMVQPPTDDQIGSMKKGAAFLGFTSPLDNPERATVFAKQGVNSFSMELVPRITRAQKMDALSAMSSVGGYQAVLIAAQKLPKFLPLLTTAAGTIRPSTVIVLGAGVAGLQALATARRLGGVTWAYDIRAAAAEEAKSLGAKFIEIDLDTTDTATSGGYAKALSEDRAERQVQMLEPHLAKGDVIISTALIPGRPAPTLISEDAVKAMAPGSVIIDMAAANGGNCPLTEAGKTVEKYGVTIIGATNLPAEMPLHASQMYSRTIQAAIEELTTDGELVIDFENEITKGFCVTHNGEVVHERVKSMLEG